MAVEVQQLDKRQANFTGYVHVLRCAVLPPALACLSLPLP